MIIERQAVRAILLTPASEVLLIRIQPPDYHAGFWIAPGGGLERGESVEAALRRELLEELGLRAFEMGPLVWRRQHTFSWDGRRIRQREHYHVVAVDRFEPHMSDVSEAKIVSELRWWLASDLANATERLTPLSLTQIVTCYLASGAPHHPPEWEVLVD